MLAILAMLLLATAIAVSVAQIAINGTTIHLHRALTHRALTLHAAVESMFNWSLWLTTGISPKEWVAVHRKHHTFTDEEGDPHSPYLPGDLKWLPNWLESRLPGWLRVQLFNIVYYVRERNDSSVVEKYAPDIPTPGKWNPRRYGFLGPILGTILLCQFLGLGWGLYAAAFHTAYYIFGSSSINSICHWFGYKNFDNTATNVKIIALATGGEGLHNNHHGFPMSPKFSYRKDEIDPAWPLIRLLVAMNLAKTKPTIEQRLSQA